MHPAIRVESLSKKYYIGSEPRDRYNTLRDALARRAGEWRRMFQPGAAAPRPNEPAMLWALRDVNFEIEPGEVVGVIGRNGAGKSTLLKIFSRITPPTSGRVELRGAVGSLLEIGSGFHMELTGRENVFLNGAILGIPRRRIQTLFDEIVAFADVAKFIDMPVKRYSSGMHVRLAFAVAAHLEPNVLLIDEVLAVGDHAFQQKCLGKIRDVASHGRTVFFVSHNMGAVQGLCRRGIYLASGRVAYDGSAADAVTRYMGDADRIAHERLEERTDRTGRGKSRIRQIDIVPAGGAATLMTGSPAQFIFRVSTGLGGLAIVFTLYDQYGVHLAACRTNNPGPDDSSDRALDCEFICEMDELLLLPGPYRVNVALWGEGELQDQVDSAAQFAVEAGQVRGRPVSDGIQYGRVHLPHRWRTPAR